MLEAKYRALGYFAEIVKKKFKPRAARDLQEIACPPRIHRSRCAANGVPQFMFPFLNAGSRHLAPPVEVYACPRRLIPGRFVISQSLVMQSEVPDLTELQARAYEKFLQQDVPADKREPVGLEGLSGSLPDCLVRREDPD